MATGRFAPTPSAPLHLGNLRTALVAWLAARSVGSSFHLRVEDLDPGSTRPGVAEQQLADLAALGLDWDGPVVWQSDRRSVHDDAIQALVATGRTYPCWCSRREVREAAAAPHGELPDGAYTGTCRDLTAAERAERRSSGRPPSLRLRAEGERIAFTDDLSGPHQRVVDDFVIRRGDGTPSYNVAVVVDDHDAGIGQVVRGDDLIGTTPRQVLVARLLGIAPPRHLHVPLVVEPDGERLAKRSGSVTLAALAERGIDVEAVRSVLAQSLALADADEATRPSDLLARFDPGAIPRARWVLTPVLLGEGDCLDPPHRRP